MDRIVAEKLAWRRRRAALPFVEKIRILVELQKRRAIIRRARGLDSLVWDITLPPPEPGSGAYLVDGDGGDRNSGEFGDKHPAIPTAIPTP